MKTCVVTGALRLRQIDPLAGRQNLHRLGFGIESDQHGALRVEDGSTVHAWPKTASAWRQEVA